MVQLHPGARSCSITVSIFVLHTKEDGSIPSWSTYSYGITEITLPRHGKDEGSTPSRDIILIVKCNHTAASLAESTV